MNRLVISFLLSLAAGSALAAKPKDWVAELQSAQKSLTTGDYQKAYAQYARHGAKNPLAQFTLGLFHQNGWGRPANPAEACRWFEKAAAKKIPAALDGFGNCLAQGIGRPADGKAAVEKYLQAADGGHIISWCSAGELYLAGKGVEQNVAKGLELCAQAAGTGSPVAMVKLADFYRQGQGGKQDLALARQWYGQAAEIHYPEAQYRLGVMLSEGQGGEPDLGKALFWLETAASEGYAPAYLPTAILYANAPVNPETHALPPDVLAKIYLWNSAAKARATDPAQLAEINRIEGMVLQVMPASWRPDLDKKVAEHLAKFK